MNKIKLCCVVSGLRSGGVESFLYNIFSNGNWDDFDIVIITHGETYLDVRRKFEDIGVRIYNVTPKHKNFFKNIREINSILKSEKFDIVHCHMTNNSCFPLFLSLINKVKVRIMHIHEKPKKSLMFKITNFLSFLFSTSYCSCSQESFDYSFVNIHKSREKNLIIYNYIDTNKFYFDDLKRKQIRNDLFINDSVFLVGLFGRFVKEKNHNFILDIIREINDENIKFLFIGDGELKKSVKDYLIKNNLFDKVLLLDYKKNIEDYYSAIDLFVLPSISEGFGIVVVEAQVSGLNCVLSDVIPKETEILENSCTYIPLDAELWKNEILSKRVCSNNRNSINIDKFKFIDINYNSNKLQSYYKGLINYEKK